MITLRWLKNYKILHEKASKYWLNDHLVVTTYQQNGNWILTKRSLKIDEMITIWWLKSHFILSDCLQMLTENQLNVNEMVTYMYCWTIHVYIPVQYIRNLMRRLSLWVRGWLYSIQTGTYQIE